MMKRLTQREGTRFLFVGRIAANKKQEDVIKAGALDCLGGTRRQFMQIYAQIADLGDFTLIDYFVAGIRAFFENRNADQIAIAELAGEHPDIGAASHRWVVIQCEDDAAGS